jgi:hypothetical protein
MFKLEVLEMEITT